MADRQLSEAHKQSLADLLWWSYRNDAYSLCRDLIYQINDKGGSRQRYEGVPLLRRVMKRLREEFRWTKSIPT